MKIKYKIKHKIVSILAIIITVINISSISSASLVGKEIKISATEYNNMPYSYNEEERKIVLRFTEENIPVYVMKKNNVMTSFTTSDIEFYNDEKIKNILKNGYGCKTWEELGSNNLEEAYIATQEAIYISKEGRNIEDYKIIEGEEERANRILNTAKDILINASKEKPSTINITTKATKWKTYEENNDYKYKEYHIESGNTIPGDITIVKGEDVKIVDKLTNEIKNTFNDGDIFYLIVPKDIEQDIKLQFNYEMNGAYLYTYRKTNALEDQYLFAEKTGLISSASFAEKVITEVNLEILNQDKETKLPIKENMFSIIKEDGTVVKRDLVTNEEGKINTKITKGKYYLQQTSTVDGYNINKALIEIDVGNQENITIKVESTKPVTEEFTVLNKEINVTEESKNVIENNITEVSNITTTNINKKIINETNETNLHNVNNFINTINRKNVTNLTKDNIYNNYIDEIFTQNKELEGENVTLHMTRKDYANYIDMIMLDSAKVPILPVASK
ncbi:MAG: Cys-Gln thioester bond-forming surface protein [Clostridia bacterium]|nr:Cys-Gln thioester bond-forming surface protein [Clostridia bacterium]